RRQAGAGMIPAIQVIIINAELGWLVAEGVDGKTEVLYLTRAQIAEYCAMEDRHIDERHNMDRDALIYSRTRFAVGGPVTSRLDVLPELVALEGYLRDTPHHNAPEAAAARKAIARAMDAITPALAGGS